MSQKTEVSNAESTEVIENHVRNAEWFYDDDKIRYSTFKDDSGKAKVNVEFDSCVTDTQMKLIQEDDIFTIDSIHCQYGNPLIHFIEEL